MKFAKTVIQRILSLFGVRLTKLEREEPPVTYPEATEGQRQLIDRFRPYTMTGKHRQWTLLNAADYLIGNGITGAIVECGVWRGGNILMLKTYFQLRNEKRITFFMIPSRECQNLVNTMFIFTDQERWMNIRNEKGVVKTG